MSDPGPVVLFLMTNADGAKVAVSQAGVRVVVALEIDGAVSAAKLEAEQAIALALSILAGNIDATAQFARRMDTLTAQQIAAALLVPTAEAELLRRATEGATPS